MLKPTRGSGVWDVHLGDRGHMLVLGMPGLLAESRDAGETWTEEAPFGRKWPVRVGLSAEGTVLVGTDKSVLFERTERGWSETAIKGVGRVEAIVRTSGATLVSGTTLLRRAAGEPEWVPALSRPKKLHAARVVATGDVLHAAFCDPKGHAWLARSDDHGASWTEHTVALPTKVESLAARGPSVIASVMGGAAFLTRDDGRTWTTIALPEYGPYNQGWVALSERAIYSLLRGSDPASLFCSTDEGARWERGESVSSPAAMIASSDGVIHIPSYSGFVLRVRGD